MVDSVNLQAVTFQRAPLGEGLFAVVAPIWTDSCMCTCVPLQIECIVEALSTEGAGVSYKKNQISKLCSSKLLSLS